MNRNIFRSFLCEQETKIIKRFLFGFCCLVFVLGIISMGPMAFGADGLVLWNGLGSDEEVLNSFVGPNLEFYTGGGGIHVQGDRDYVAGYDGDEIQDLMVKFDRQVLIALLKNMNAKDGDEIALTVSGKLTGDESFEGSCTLTVINKGKK